MTNYRDTCYGFQIGRSMEVLSAQWKSDRQSFECLCILLSACCWRVSLHHGQTTTSVNGDR
jgi:hypothetical protein